ncbi:MAG: hypothetical protein M3Q68_02870 [Actinomycetota bacterium]|nr:hypothetical protein [Actinomycetota bacterium]
MTVAPTSRDEGSTIVTAMIVLLILGTLSSATLSRTLAVLASMRHGQDYDAALAAADAGLSDALYRIDLTATPRTAAPTFTGASDVGSGHLSYVATRTSDASYEIASVGEVGSSRHAIRARVTRQPKFPFALFSGQDLRFDGNSSANIYSFVTRGQPTGEALVGSNHQIVVGSGKGAGDEQHYYAPYGGCSGCPKPVAHLEETKDVQPVTAPTGPTQPCPGTGTFSGTVNGGGGIPYVCRRDVTLSGTITVTNGPFILTVLPTAVGEPPVHHSLDVSGAIVNPTGHSIDVQIFKAGNAPLIVGNGNTSNTMTFNGIMYAPESTVTVSGGKFWLGSWVVDSLQVNGGPNIEIGYDLDTRTYYGFDWKVDRYEEIPSASALVPAPG